MSTKVTSLLSGAKIIDKIADTLLPFERNRLDVLLSDKNGIDFLQRVADELIKNIDPPKFQVGDIIYDVGGPFFWNIEAVVFNVDGDEPAGWKYLISDNTGLQVADDVEAEHRLATKADLVREAEAWVQQVRDESAPGDVLPKFKLGEFAYNKDFPDWEGLYMWNSPQLYLREIDKPRAERDFSVPDGVSY